eukprot:220023_1
MLISVILILTMINMPISLSTTITGNTFIATQTDQFYNYTINCDDDKDCEVQCFASPSLKNTCSYATINCPPNDGKACNVSCSGSAFDYRTIEWFSCKELTINWIVGNLNSLKCDKSCDNVAYPPSIDDKTPLIVNCGSKEQCYGNTISCPLNASCDVICSGDSSCEYSTIYCPHRSYCNITCSGSYACRYMEINWSSSFKSLSCEGARSCYGVMYPVPTNDATPFLLKCNSPNAHYGLLITCPKHARCDIVCTASGCPYAIILCPSDAVCNIVCNGTRSCYNMHPKWSDILGLGSLSCDGERSCQNILFPPVIDNLPLTITCDNTSQCNSARIICPTNATCTVQCVANSACYNTEIIWSTLPGLGSLICSGDYSCAGTNFPPQLPNVPYIAKCNETSKCRWSTILCPTNADCIVQCIGSNACLDAVMVWPTNRSVAATLECNVSSDCYGASPEPKYIVPNNNADLILNCITEYNCSNYVVDCPTNGGCYISCNATGACKGMVVNWAESQPNDLYCGHYSSVCYGIHFKPYNQSAHYSAECSGFSTEGPGVSSSCAAAIFDCPSNARCTILCGPNNACRSAVINGPSKHELNVVCTEYYSCFSSTIHAESASYFELDCSYNDACPWITIYFPQNSELIPSNVILVNKGIEKATFYALNGYQDVNVIYTNSTTNIPRGQYDLWLYNAEIFCNVDYVDSGDSCEHVYIPQGALSVDLASITTQDVSDVCTNDSSNYLDARYKINIGINSCIDGVIQLISYFMHIIDVMYSENKLVVTSNITKETRQQLQVYDGSLFCGNITLHIISCFDSMGTKADDLLNKTNTMIDDLNQIIPFKYINHTIIIYLLNITIRTIYVFNTTTVHVIDEQSPIPWYMHYRFYIAICALMLCTFITITIWCVKRRRKRERAKQALLIK